jgi:hypothetical protein
VSDAICDEIERADREDRVILPERVGAALVEAAEIESTMLQFAEHLKYPLARPDEKGRHAVLMMNYLPDLPDTLAYHYSRMGWRWHPEKALVKQRPVVGGVFDDLVAYVGLDEPDDPIIVRQNDGVVEHKASSLAAMPWSGVKPVVNIVDEERPADD